MLRLVEEDWTARLQARLREDSEAHREGHDEPAEESPRRGDDRLHFGPYGSSPLSGLHFETADDTAAS